MSLGRPGAVCVYPGACSRIHHTRHISMPMCRSSWPVQCVLWWWFGRVPYLRRLIAWWAVPWTNACSDDVINPVWLPKHELGTSAHVRPWWPQLTLVVPGPTRGPVGCCGLLLYTWWHCQMAEYDLAATWQCGCAVAWAIMYEKGFYSSGY